MSVHRRKDGIWFAKWRDNLGKEHRKYFGKDGEKEARRWDAQRKQAEANATPESLTLVELASKYFEARDDLNPHTRKRMVNLITRAAKPFATKPCENITRGDLQTLRTNLRHVKPTTRNKAQAYLSAIINWGVEQELIYRNPWAGARKLKEEQYIVTATIGDFRAILKHAAPHLAWAMDVSLNLVLRPGYVELLSLQWDSFNWEQGFVAFMQGKRAGIKKVFPSDAFLARAKKRFLADKAKGVPLVVHYKGQRIKSLKTAWKAAKRRAGYKDHPIRMYDIRHIAVSEMLAASGDLIAVQKQTGHKHGSTTVNMYGHVLREGQKRAAECLPDLEEEDENPKKVTDGDKR